MVILLFKMINHLTIAKEHPLNNFSYYDYCYYA
jgi:hypothetical protein